VTRRRVIAVIVIAPALGMAVPVIPPVLAQEACTTWTVGMVEDEGGEVLMAQACARERPDAWLSLSCFSGQLFVRYDLGLGAEAAPELDEVTDVTFSTGSDAATIAMSYQAMDGMHAADAGLDDPLVQLLKAGDTVTISDVPGRYPVKSFSLAGSARALTQLVAGCD
jgi:hypothetical protein